MNIFLWHISNSFVLLPLELEQRNAKESGWSKAKLSHLERLAKCISEHRADMKINMDGVGSTFDANALCPCQSIPGSPPDHVILSEIERANPSHTPPQPLQAHLKTDPQLYQRSSAHTQAKRAMSMCRYRPRPAPLKQIRIFESRNRQSKPQAISSRHRMRHLESAT
jgi:hypothetical protein